MVRPICWMITGASPSVGSSSRSRRAPVRRMRADRQHLLLAAGQLGALAGEPLAEVGKQLEDLRSRASPPGLTCGGSSRFSSTLRLAKMPRSSGQIAMPARAIWFEARPDQLASLELHRAGALGDHAHDRLQGRGLAGAVAPEQRHHLAAIAPRTSRREARGIRRTRPAGPRPRAARLRPIAHPEIGLAHLRVRRHGRVVAFGEDAAARQHGDAVGQIGDDAEIVLDHQDGAVRRRPT